MRTVAAAVAALAISATAHAAPSVAAAWSRPAVQGMTGVGYMTVRNPGPKPDALIGVESPVAPMVMMHKSSMEGGVSSMAPVERLALPPGGSVTFAPGGYHLMFMRLARPLKLGETFPATLKFESGAKVTAQFVVGLAPPAS